MTEPTSFLHQGSIGDCWASIPAMKEYHTKTGKKVLLYLANGVKAFYYEGASHPTMAEDGATNVMLNETMINMMIPLFKAQEFIEDCRIWTNQPVKVNLGKIRETFVNMPNGDLRMWYVIVYPDLACDFTKQYITVPDTEKDLAKSKIIISRTERYLNPAINYSFLKKYTDDFVFVGTDLEYAIFTIRYKLNIPRLIINDFLELAQALKQSKGLVANQTQIFQIAEGLKIPRVVELCKFAPNVIPMGEKAFYFYAQEALEYYVSILKGETPKTQTNGFLNAPLKEENLGVK